MTSAEAIAAIKAHWLRTWPTKSTGIVATVTGSIPSNLDTIVMKEPPAYLAALKIRELASDQYTMGPPGKRKVERSGLIQVRLTGPLNVGTGPLDQLAQVVRKQLFELRRIQRTDRDRGIVCEETVITSPENDKDAARFDVRLCSTVYRFTDIT